MRRRAPALAGAVILVCIAACSAHVDVGLSKDAGPPPRVDASDGGLRAEVGVTRAEPSSGETTWARVRAARH
jgi:hypothetical protein